MLLLYTLVCTVLHVLLISIKTTGRTLLPIGRYTIQIKMALSEQ
jgi:hypothetical protein